MYISNVQAEDRFQETCHMINQSGKKASRAEACFRPGIQIAPIFHGEFT
jgi:hypothetical protein